MPSNRSEEDRRIESEIRRRLMREENRRESEGVVVEFSAKGREKADVSAKPRSGQNRSAARRPENRRPAERRNPSPGFGVSGNRNTGKRGGSRRRAKSKIVYFYIFSLLAGVIVCLVLFAMAFQTILQNNPVIAGATTPSPTPIPVEGKDFRQSLCMVMEINSHANPRTFSLLELSTGRTAEYALRDSADIKNRFGEPMAFSEIRIGKLIDIGYEANTTIINTLSESAQAWELKYRNNGKINIEESIITIGNDTYHYNRQTLVLYRGQPYPVSQIKPVDTVSMTGHQNNVWHIQLDSSHGFLRINGMEKVENGTLAIDSSIYMALKDVSDNFTLAEGTHRVIVEGVNIESFITDIVIHPGETFTINLANVELKHAMLYISVNEPDCEIIIDGQAKTGKGPFQVTFGEHTVRVEKYGFIPVQQQINITNLTNTLSFELNREVKTAALIIFTSPSMAEIYIDNVYMGYTSPSLTLEVETGARSVTARLNGYKDTVITVEITEGENYRSIMLLPESSDPWANLPPPQNAEEPIEEPPLSDLWP